MRQVGPIDLLPGFVGGTLRECGVSLGWSSLSSEWNEMVPGITGVDRLSLQTRKSTCCVCPMPPVFRSALGLDYISLASSVSTHFTFPSPDLPSLQPLLPPPPCPGLPFPLLPFPSRGFSERYLISVRAGLTAIQYAFSLSTRVGKAESFSRGSG